MFLRMDGILIDSEKKKVKSLNPAALAITYLTGGAAVCLTVVCIPFLSPALRRICLPYVPATTKQVENVLTALSTRSRSGKCVDLGSGDGRIVVAAARSGFISHGVEINPFLVLYSRIAAFKAGVSHLTKFYSCDLWKTSLMPYKNIIIFGVDEMVFHKEMEIIVNNGRIRAENGKGIKKWLTSYCLQISST
ncbi:ATP synthase subunit C lysine N-methyltransferase isoform X2 [Lycorma delicatula]|uniref:ATP synthase subunit C lysine N-methyltransferase isoform X2 n=1 Tax=Lycorma delicatula TaxID=130591 RepID=UPI003F518D5B